MAEAFYSKLQICYADLKQMNYWNAEIAFLFTVCIFHEITSMNMTVM